MTYHRDLYHPQITSADACRAAGIDSATLRNWVSREPATILLDKNERLPGDRPTFVLQIATVYQIAIVAALVKLGLKPSQASQWAWTFTEVDEKGRPAGTLFKKEFTYLAGDAAMERPQVLNITESTKAWDVLTLTDVGGPVILLNLNGILTNVNRELGI